MSKVPDSLGYYLANELAVRFQSGVNRSSVMKAEGQTETLRVVFGPLGALALQAAMIDPHWYLRGDDD